MSQQGGIDRGGSLLQAILDEPGADDLRLIYADYLQDQGNEERAELMRMGRHAKIVTDGVGRLLLGVMNARQSVAIRRLLADVTRDMTGLPNSFTFSRGFLTDIYGIDPMGWHQHGPRIVREHPLEYVEWAGEWVHQAPHSGIWYVNRQRVPDWLTPLVADVGTRVRELALRYLSSQIIAWALAQEVGDGG